MRLPDGTIIMHGRAPYDPHKAHEYYLRTRQLKGRKKGSSYTVQLGGGNTVRLSEQQLTEQKAYAAKRVGEIKTRLKELSTKLNEMKAAAQHPKKEKPTVADRSKAARESKQYRDKHQSKLATKRRTEANKSNSTKSKSKKSSIVELEHKIVKIRSNLRAAVAKQRSLAAATRNG